LDTPTFEVSTYDLRAGNGKHVRVATQVVINGTTTLKFTEKLSKREAIRQANIQLAWAKQTGQAITHYLQVQADHGAWVDHLALWSCADDTEAQRRAEAHRCQFPDRPHRLITAQERS
jgi:hypothetical protein